MIKRIFFICLIFFTLNVRGQYKFAWITDTHIGFDRADTELKSIVENINELNDIKFVVITGDITEKGLNSELELAQSILDDLNKPYYIIPGNHDSKWSESGCTKFTELWDDNKFSFKFQNHTYIGLDSSIPWKGGGGHIRPEDLDWLENELAETDTASELYILTHHPLDETIDNWYKVSNLVKDYNIIAFYNGHGHDNKISEYKGMKQIMSRAAISKDRDSWGYTIVENDSSEIFFYEATGIKEPEKWGSIKKSRLDIEYIKPDELLTYSTEIISKTNLHTTLSASPLIWYNRIITADYSGIVSCYDTTFSLLWDYDAFGNVLSKPVEKDGYLAVGTMQGDLVTIKAKTGEPLQSLGMNFPITSQLLAIDYDGNKSLMLPKQSNSKAAVIFGNSNGRVNCYDLETLQEYWINEQPGGMIETKPLLLNNEMYFGCWDSYFYSIDVRSGLLIWKWHANDNFYYSPAAVEPVTDGKRIYITTPEKYLYALDARLGTLEWKKKNYNAWESVGISNDNRLLYVKSYKDHFHTVSTITSNWVRDIDMKFGIDTMPTKPIEWKDYIIFGSKSGFVYRIDKKWNFEPVLYLGPARVHSVQHVRDNIFLASNMDGRIVLFKL